MNMHWKAEMRFRRLRYLVFECLVPVIENFNIAIVPKNHSQFSELFQYSFNLAQILFKLNCIKFLFLQTKYS